MKMYPSKSKVIKFLFFLGQYFLTPITSGGEGGSPQKSISKERRGPSTVCKPCNLVFENQRWLDTHTKSGDHNHVVKVILDLNNPKSIEAGYNSAAGVQAV